MVYGYIRVSTIHQNLENQQLEIEKFAWQNGLHIDKWVEEKISGIKIFPPSVNFVLFRHEKADKILNELRREKILLRSCANFAGLDETFLRSAIRSHKENLRLFDALKKILEVIK